MLSFFVSDSSSRLSANNPTTKTSVRDGPEPRGWLDEVSVLSVGTRCWWVFPVPKCKCKPDKQNPVRIWWTWDASMWVPVLIVLEEDWGSRFLVGPVLEGPPDTSVPIGLTCLECPQGLPVLDQHSLEGDIGAFSQENLDWWNLLTGQFTDQWEWFCVGLWDGEEGDTQSNPDKHPHHRTPFLLGWFKDHLVSRSTTSPSLRFQSRDVVSVEGLTPFEHPWFGKMKCVRKCVQTFVQTPNGNTGVFGGVQTMFKRL